MHDLWLCVFTTLTLTLPYLTKSNKQAFLLAHARSVFDDVINQIHTGRNILRPGVDCRGLARVGFAWCAEGPGVEPGVGGDKKNENVFPDLAPSHHIR